MIAVVILALGIGATTAMFAVVNGVLLKPLPYHDPSSLMLVHLERPDYEGRVTEKRPMVWSYPKYRMFLEGQHAFESSSLFALREISLTNVGEPERIRGEVVSARYAETVGIQPILGRTFRAEDANVADGVAIVGEGLWRRRFGSASDILGRPVYLEGRPYTVVGVLPRAFRGLSGQADVWVPVEAFEPTLLDQPYAHSYTLVARRKPYVSDDAAMAAMRTLGAEVDRRFPDRRGAAWGATAESLSASRIDGDVRRTVLMLLTAIGLVLFIACVNLTTLMATKTAGRQREIAVRLALGARPLRVIRQLFVESLVLSSIGGVAGVFVAAMALSVGQTLLPRADVFFQRSSSGPAAMRGASEGLTRVGAAMIGIDMSTLVFALLMVTGCAVLIGALPGLYVSTLRPNDRMKQYGRGVVGRPRGRTPLVAMQIALGLVVIVAAGLMLKSVWRLQALGIGINRSEVVALRLQVPTSTYTPVGVAGTLVTNNLDNERIATLLTSVLERVKAIAGVHAAALASCAPASGGCGGTSMSVGAPTENDPPVSVYLASPEYFDTLGIQLIHGRGFDASDRTGHPRVVVVNEAAARAFWPGANAIGEVVRLGVRGFDEGAEVVGVVPDVQYEAVERAIEPGVYLPLLQVPRNTVHLFVRGELQTDALVAAVRTEMRSLDPNLPLSDIRTIADRIADATWRPRVSAWLLTGFAALAILLVAVGIFGLTAEIVNQRTREFAVRIALGAQPRHVVFPLIQRAVVLTAIGLASGIVVGLAVMKPIASLLSNVETTDSGTFGFAAGLLAAVAIIASYLPARRAMRIEPTSVLNAE